MRADSRAGRSGSCRTRPRPTRRALQRRPQLVDQRHVAGALREIGARQHDEKRRGVDPAVVERERHFAGGGHFALAHLVHDLAGRGVAERRVLARLIFGQKAQHAARKPRLQPQRLQRGDDRVAAERCRKPRDAGVRIGAGRRVGGQQAEIGKRTVDPGIEKRIARAHARRWRGGARAWQGGRPPALRAPRRVPRAGAQCRSASDVRDACCAGAARLARPVAPSPQHAGAYAPRPPPTDRSTRRPEPAASVNSRRDRRTAGPARARMRCARRAQSDRARHSRAAPRRSSTRGGSMVPRAGRARDRALRTCRGNRWRTKWTAAPPPRSCRSW